jgi:hypothetical protein
MTLRLTNMVMMVSLARRRTSPPHDGIQRWPQVHRTRGSLGMTKGLGQLWARGGNCRVGTWSGSGRQSWSTPSTKGVWCAIWPGFGGSCMISSALGVGGLVAFGDSSPSGALFVEESGLMSWALCTEVHKLQIDQV